MHPGLEGLPSRRHSLRGRDLDGAPVELSASISKQLYYCPGCRKAIQVGGEHTLVRYVDLPGGARHQHWHRACVETSLMRELRDLTPVPVDSGGRLSKGRRRKESLERRRRR